MEVLLKSDVKGLGKKGEKVENLIKLFYLCRPKWESSGDELRYRYKKFSVRYSFSGF